MSEPLEPQIIPPDSRERRFVDYVQTHWAAVSAVTLAALAVVVCGIVVFSGEFESMMPPLAISVPFALVTLGLAIASLVRREGSYRLPALSVALAGSAIFFGWAFVIIVGGTLTVCGLMALGEAI